MQQIRKVDLYITERKAVVCLRSNLSKLFASWF